MKVVIWKEQCNKHRMIGRTVTVSAHNSCFTPKYLQLDTLLFGPFSKPAPPNRRVQNIFFCFVSYQFSIWEA